MNKRTPVTTFLDIETSPLLGWAWQAYEANILKIVEPIKVIAVAWKYQGAEDTYCRAICDQKTYKPGNLNDKEVVNAAWKVLDKTDVLVTQNGDKFDIRQLNARFAFYGLNAPSAYKSVDTLKLAKKYFRFESNKLDSLGQYFGEGQKSETNLGLWFKCMAGDPKAWQQLKDYNKNDVDLLEKVYLHLRPFHDSHPNMNVFTNNHDLNCSTCLSKNLTRRGFSITQTGRKQRYQCSDCGSWSSGKFERLDVSIK